MAQFPKVPKVREYAELVMNDGAVLSGYLFVEATSRIQDVLNSELPFFAFVDEDEQVFLVNKAAVVRVRPYDR